MQTVEIPARESSFIKLRQDEALILSEFLPLELKEKVGTHILSVGCGFAPEAVPITQQLKDAHFEAIDIGATVIKGARSFNPELSPDNFRVADARDPSAFGEIPWDMIIFRNPQIHGQYETGYSKGVHKDWVMIFVNSISKLSPGGYIYLACDDIDEINETKKYIEGLGLNCVIDTTSLGDLDLRSNFPQRENYVAILQGKPV